MAVARLNQIVDVLTLEVMDLVADSVLSSVCRSEAADNYHGGVHIFAVSVGVMK